MMPNLQQRLIIGFALVIGGLCWLGARGALIAADGSGGISLMDARVGVITATAVLIVAGLPAIVLALAAASTGNPLAGAFTVSGSLLILTAMSGSIQGYLHRAQLPGGYRQLAIESGIWLVLLFVVLVVIDRLRKRVRPMLGKLAGNQHLGRRTKLTLPGVRPMLAGLVTAGVGGFIANILIQSFDGGQVNGSLMIGFGVAAMIGRMVVPQRNPLVILLSPMVVAIGAYLYVLSSHPSADAFLASLYSRDVLNLALALPIQYASAGVAGCAMGVGMAQSLEHIRHTTTLTA